MMTLFGRETQLVEKAYLHRRTKRSPDRRPAQKKDVGVDNDDFVPIGPPAIQRSVSLQINPGLRSWPDESRGSRQSQ